MDEQGQCKEDSEQPVINPVKTSTKSKERTFGFSRHARRYITPKVLRSIKSNVDWSNEKVGTARGAEERDSAAQPLTLHR